MVLGQQLGLEGAETGEADEQGRAGAGIAMVAGEVQAQAGALDSGVQRQPRLEAVLPDQAETRKSQ